MPSCEMFSRLDMELERERENELSSLSTRPVGNIHTLGLLSPRERGAGGARAGRGRGAGLRAPPAPPLRLRYTYKLLSAIVNP